MVGGSTPEQMFGLQNQSIRMDSKQAPKTCKRQAGGRAGEKTHGAQRSARNRVNSRGKEKTL